MIEYLIEIKHFLIYGNIDNFVLILGAFTGFEIEKYLPKKFQTGLGAIYGAGLGNALSDFIAGVGAGDMNLAIGTSVGCLMAMFIIPIFGLVGKLRQYFKK